MSNSNILKVGSLLSKFPNNGSKVKLPQELKDKLVSVVSAYGKSNSDEDRDIIKDKTGNGNDFQILNAYYKLNSSFGKYEIDFTTWLKSSKITDFDDKSFKFYTNESWVLLYHKSNINKDTPSFKIHIDIEQKVGDLYYNYVDSNGVWKTIIIKSEEFETPVSYNTLYTGETPVNIGFTTSGLLKGSVTQISSFQGAFTTDGIDDLIMSQKSVSDMLDGSNEYTVLSMIHHIDVPEGNRYSNVIRIKLNSWGASNKITSSSNNKTGIYGYTVKDTSVTIINNILGDKNDYDIKNGTDTSNLAAKFSVIGWIGEDDILRENSSIAWYWTVIAKAVLTTDEINQVIAYYNLDRPGEIVKPDILYDVKKQGITNENHAEFNDELIDFSGNNYNLKLYNMLWDKQSGIGNYPISFKDYTYVPSRATVQVNKNSFTITSNSNTGNFLEVNTKNKTLPIYKVKVEGTNTITNGELSYRFNNTEGVISRMSIPEDGEYEIPESPSTVNSVYSGWCINGGTNDNLNIKITLLPTDDITNAVVLDGISSFGKVSNIPILKDYTVAAFRKWLYGDSVTSTETGSIVSKSKVGNNGAFIFEQTLNRNPPRSSTFSFGTINSLMSNDKLFEESFTYQTKYSYNGNSIQPGTGVDSDSMWLGLIRDNDSRYSKMAIWSLLLFPYSLSEFLLERQLKKYKLGTLYPNQVEFRPIVNSNLEYKSIQYINKADGTDMVVGQYYPSDTSIQILITPTQPNKVNKITINGKEPVFINSDNGVYKYEWYFDGKSPQQIKLKLGIDETLVQFNPIINSNVEYKLALYYNVEGSWVKINPGDYITIGTRISIKIFPNNIDKLVAVNSIDLENISTINKVTGEESYYCYANVTSKSPQNIDIVIDEYIRYEDIKQPYPVIFRLFNKDTNKEYTWGDIIKIGSIINIKSLIFSLNKFYSINGYSVNNKGNYGWMQISSMDIEVIKTLSFSSNSTWKFGQGPLFIYDPSLINNIGLKNLGYLPDITGQNNNLNLYNFEYIPNSGKGQYLIDFNENWIFNNAILKDQIVTFNRNTSSSGIFFANIPNSYKADIPSFTVNVDFTNTTNNNAPAYYYWNEEGIRQFIYLIKGKNILPINYASKSNDSSATGSGFHDSFCDTVTIEQVAFNEEALCFDGIDNYGNIPSITNVKSILMQVKWSYLGKILYDQRKNYNSEFAILSDDTNLNGDKIYAYQARNNGNTYIQGFLNKNLYASALKDLLHNIIITNDLTEISQNPYIGCTIETTYFSKMAMYKVMGFDKVISEDEIKLLNENWLGLGNNFIYLNPNIQIDTTLAIKYIKIFQNNEEVNRGYLFTGAQNGVEFELRISLAEGKYGLDEITVDGETISSSSEIDGYKVFKFTLLGTNEQNITIHTYDYIMYEDIPQPYPAFFYYNDKETKKDYIWGDKVKVGSIINVRSIDNLLSDLYTINSYILNGESLNYSALISKDIVVSNNLSVGCITTYKLKGSAPKCIFSPEKLKIPNSSYRYLGYIPDISGNGNHGVFNNFAFSGMSGADGYGTNLGNWNVNSSNYGKIKTRKINYLEYEVISESKYLLFYNIKVENETFIIYADIDTHISYLNDSEYEFLVNIPAKVPTKVICPKVGTILLISDEMPTIGNIITVQQEGLYDGSICFDGVDDFVTIPTTVGGKQVLMKVNWNSYIGRGILYDQRGYLNEFAIYNRDLDSSDNHVFAYQARNNGQTYIDGILNNNIDVSELRNITHNITITNELSAGVNTSSPVIGSNRLHNDFFANMALYDFMLFDNISTDDKIKELNEYVGTEGNFVEWNPTITTNISSTYAITPNIRKSDGIIVKLVKGNIYSTSITGNLVLNIVPPNKDLDEVTNVIIDGKSYTPIKYQYTDYYRVEIPLIFPQEINVIIDEYITYETIEQPYPIFLNYIDKETNKAYTWGDKVKVDSILKISGYKNLFENGDTSLGGSNGYSVNGSSELIALGTLLTSEILVNKINTGVRSSVIWNLNTPKPLFAYDPSIINNVGLKNLGYLPDITGQGRHLLLNEFAYEGMSGINGYPVVLGVNKTWETVSGTANYTSYITSNNIHVTHVKRANYGLLYSYVKLNGKLTNIKEIPSFKVNIKGLEGNSRVRYYYLATENATSNSVLNLKNGINEISKSFIPTDTLLNNSNNVWIGFSISAISDEVNSFDCDITIEILPNYEGTLCFDGINDYGIVSNLPSQYIKTLLMKVNWMKDTPMLLYDQRGGSYFGILTTQESDINNTKIAYQARNPNGKTYIDGIENNYIETYTLKDITHNITITNSNVNTIVTPVIGSNSGHSANFAQMAMYKVMGLPEIPSDEEIKTINNWAGIEAKVELPSYYWDTYGKTNSDADRDTIQQRGIAVGDYDLINYNHAYEGMSGYNGYPVVFGKSKTWEAQGTKDGDKYYIYTSNANKFNITQIKISSSLFYTYIKRNGELTSGNKDIPSFNLKVTGLDYDKFYLAYYYLKSADVEVRNVINITSDGIYELPKSFASDGSLTETNLYIGLSFIKKSSEIPDIIQNINVTIEVLPEYENGLVYDGVDDYSKNENIPILTDFTFIIKREILGLETNESMLVIKGDKVYNNGIGNAFILEHNNNGVNYVYSYGKLNWIKRDDSKIIYLTPESYNGNPIIKGENGDNLGLVLSRHWRGIIYKTILYSKTISLLQINFLKNLMEKDEIIDLNNPIFIKNNK